MIEIRRAEAGDTHTIAALAQEVHAIHVTAHPDIFQASLVNAVTSADFERFTSDSGHVVLVADVAGEIVGYGHAEVQETPDTPDTPYKRASALLHLHAMGVTAAYRGRALLTAVREVATARGIGGLSLDVYTFNTVARAFYAREGFVPLKERLVAPEPMARP